MPTELDLVVQQGDTFQRIIRWETPPFIYKAITGISNAAPMVVTAVGHGLTSGWRVAVVSVLGMRQANAKHTPPRTSEFKRVTVADVDNVSFNDVNSAEYDAYTSGGYLQFYTPVDLTGYTARMTIKDRTGGEILLTLTSGAPDNRLVIDVAARTITLTITATDTAPLAFTKGVYDLEMASPSGVVAKLYYGSITVRREITT